MFTLGEFWGSLAILGNSSAAANNTRDPATFQTIADYIIRKYNDSSNDLLFNDTNFYHQKYGYFV